MPNYVKISGTKTELLSLGGIIDLQIRPRTARETGVGMWEVFAYATDAAITDVQGRGPSVEIVVTEAQRQAHLTSLDDFIGDESEDTDFA